MHRSLHDLKLLSWFVFWCTRTNEVNSSLYFNGSTYKYAVMDDYSLLQANDVGDISLSAWVWFDSSIDYYGSIMSNRVSSTGYNGFLYAFAKYSNSYSPFLQYRYNNIATSNSYNYIDGDWHHSVITLSNYTMRFYMDGIEYWNYTRASYASWNISTNHPLWIGLDTKTSTTQFSGYLLDLSIWQRGLTEDEVNYLGAIRIKDSALLNDTDLLHYFPADNASNYDSQYFEDLANGHDAYLGMFVNIF